MPVEVAPHSKTVCCEYDSGIIPESRRNIKVNNIGRADVYAEYIYGTKFSWIGNITTATVNAGESKILNSGGRSYFVTGLRLHNDTDVRAIVEAGYSSDRATVNLTVSAELALSADPAAPAPIPAKTSLEAYRVINELATVGVKYIPYVSAGLSGLINALWPESTPSVWEQIQNRVLMLVDEKTQKVVEDTINEDVKDFKERMSTLITDMNVGGKSAAPQYIQIAEDLIGFEKKFILGGNSPEHAHTNFYLLPLYSSAVYLKLTFYAVSILQQKKIGLNHEELEKIKQYAFETVGGEDGAVSYIMAMYKERVTNAYNTANANCMYETMMMVRTFIAVHGLEYIPIWKNMLTNPTKDKEVYVDVISYSSHFGETSADLDEQATTLELREPLTPSLVDGKRNKLTSIDIFIWRSNRGESNQGPPKIGGMKLHFEDGAQYTMGSPSTEVTKVDFKGAQLSKFVVYGEAGKLDQFDFVFSDGREVSVGTKEPDSAQNVFEFRDHHIVSIYLSIGQNVHGRQAASVIVSYQLTEIK